MKIEVGKKYLTRDGKVVGITEKRDNQYTPYVGSNMYTYSEDGRVYITMTCNYDLISEYQEPTMEKTTTQERHDMVFHFLNNGHCAKSAVAEAEIVLAFVYGKKV